MTRPREQRYNLAQYARRAGLSEGRARALHTHADGSKLAPVDGVDPDGKPFWFATTIDAWCQRTQRRMPEDAPWPFNCPPADKPAPEVDRGEVTIETDTGVTAEVSVIVWDTPGGHVVYVMRRADQPDLSVAAAARAAVHVLSPVFWNDAVVLVPQPRIFGSAFAETDHVGPESIDVYRLVVPETQQPAPRRPSRLPRFLSALVDEPRSDDADPAPLQPHQVRAEYVSYPYATAIEHALGRPMPVWFFGTCTRAAVERMRVYGDSGTFLVPDTATAWPGARARLAAAVEAGMPARYPQAFALLAADTLGTLTRVRRQHATAQERGPGWYAVARPAEPDWPIALETVATDAARTVFDPDAAADELPRIRAEEANLAWDNPYAEALYDTAATIGAKLHRSHPELVFAADTRLDLSTSGPVTEQYRSALTPLSDTERLQLLDAPTRRLARLLLAETNIAAIRETGLLDRALGELAGLYRDPAGRLVALDRQRPGDDSLGIAAEWPTTLPTGWNERTVIAADPHRPALIVALTPTPDGELRVDPLPNPGGEPGFTWGYSGSGPRTLYQALVRCVTRDWTADPDTRSWLIHLTHAWSDTTGSPLYHYLTTHEGPLRLPWGQIQEWVQADLDTLMQAKNPPAATNGDRP